MATEDIPAIAHNRPQEDEEDDRTVAADGAGLLPCISYDGRTFLGAEDDFEDLSSQYEGVVFGGGCGWSISFSARWDSLNKWSRIIDFGNGPDNANIFVGNRAYSSTLFFQVRVGSVEAYVQAPDAIRLGQSHNFLCSVTAGGHMKIFVDKCLVAENPKGMPPSAGPRRNLYVGKSSWSRDQPFHGVIAELCVWNAAMDCDLARAEDASEHQEPSMEVRQESDVLLAAEAESSGTPVFAYKGREFIGARDDFEDLTVQYGRVAFTGPFSIAFTARWDSLAKWSRIIDFGNGPEGSNVFVGNRSTTTTLVFHVWIGGLELKLHAPDAIVLGETHRYLCSVSAGGRMRIYRDGRLLNETHKGAPLTPGPRRFLYVAKSNWDRDAPFHGLIADMVVWNTAVGWDGGSEQEEVDMFHGRLIFADLARLSPRQVEEEGFEGGEWLENRAWDCLPVFWSVHCEQTGINAEQDSVAMMTLASEDTVLILRTHQTQPYLPSCVTKALLSEGMKKLVPIGFHESTMSAMERTFKFPPVGLLKLEKIAARKGFDGSSLQSLAEYFGFTMRKDADPKAWSADELTQEQIQRAADAAHISYMVFDKLQVMQDVVRREYRDNLQAIPREVNAPVIRDNAVLQLTEAWAEQGLEQESNGLRCALCQKGPLTSEIVVRTHLAAQKHQRRFQMKKVALVSGVSDAADANDPVSGPVLDLPPGLDAHGIEKMDSLPGCKQASYRCTLCSAGPFNAIEIINNHLRSKKHKNKVAAAKELEQISKGGSEITVDPFAQGRWNLPDYVQERGGTLVCTLCNSEAKALLPMRMHLGGDRHGRKCRGNGHKELKYDEDRQRLEEKATGKPVVRKGFREPPESDDSEEDEDDVEAKEEKAQTPEDRNQEEPETEEEKKIDGEHIDKGESEERLMVSSLADGVPTKCGSSQSNETVSEDEGGAHDEARRASVVRFAEHVTTHLILGESGGKGTTSKTEGPLPEGWKECMDRCSGTVYYWNAARGISQWERPEESVAVSLVVEAQRIPGEASLLEHETCKPDTASLPPGWHAVWDAGSAAHYYVDLEGKISQWEPPPVYVHRDWTRQVDPTGRAFWSSGQLDISFYEINSGEWERFTDKDGRTYWSNGGAAIRFFEEFAGSSAHAHGGA